MVWLQKSVFLVPNSEIEIRWALTWLKGAPNVSIPLTFWIWGDPLNITDKLKIDYTMVVATISTIETI